MLGRARTNLSGGIVGLANVGKSTFFQAITRSKLGNPANFPFATIEPSEARVTVPSHRLSRLAELYNPRSVVPANFNIVDIAGLVRGAAKGDGLGNAFLANIRAVDGLFQLVRTFDDEDIVHVENSVDPIRDAQIVHDELVLKDMEFILKAAEQAERQLKSTPSQSTAGADLALTLETCNKAMKALDAGKRIDSLRDWTEKQLKNLQRLNLLTTKPSVYIANMSEEEWCFGDPQDVIKELRSWVADSQPGSQVVPLSVNFESRLALLSDAEAKAELEALGEGVQSNLEAVIVAMRKALGLQSFFTTGKDEVREWTVRAGSTAPQAASLIHEDLARTFINSQVISYDDCIALQADESALKRAGKIQTKGKDYVVEDGDILQINAAAARKK